MLELPYSELPLSNGYFAKVDAGDFLWLNQWKWSASFESRNRRKVYALRRENRGGKRIGIKLHRFIMGVPEFLEDPERRVVHHKNDDGLDCRRANLEVVSQFVNMRLAPRWARAPGFPPPPGPADNYELCRECARATHSRLIFICSTCAVGIWL